MRSGLRTARIENECCIMDLCAVAFGPQVSSRCVRSLIFHLFSQAAHKPLSQSMNPKRPERPDIGIQGGPERGRTNGPAIVDGGQENEHELVNKNGNGVSHQNGYPENGDGHLRASDLLPWGEVDPALQGRTRFFVELAVEYGPRLSALVYLVAIHTNGKHRRGRRGRKNAWHKAARWYGQQIGVSSRQVARLLEQAAEEGLLDYERTGRGLCVWVVGKRPWPLLDQHDKREYALGYYDTKLAKGMGIVAACIFDLLEQPRTRNNEESIRRFERDGDRLGLDAEKLRELIKEAGHLQPLDDSHVERDREYRQLDYKGVHARLPWITEREADNELRRLYALGLIKRKPMELVGAGLRGTRWLYYSQNCLQKTL